MKLRALDYYNTGNIMIYLEDEASKLYIVTSTTLELAKQEATKVLGDLQLMLLTLEVEK
jgi:hypothetical protein